MILKKSSVKKNKAWKFLILGENLRAQKLMQTQVIAPKVTVKDNIT